MFAIELSTSIDCAREMRGTASMASAVIPRVASDWSSSGRRAGLSSAITVAPSPSRAISSGVGAFTFRITSAAHASSPSTTRRARVPVGAVGQRGVRAGACLHDDVVAEAADLLHGEGCRGDPVLTGLLGDDADARHACSCACGARPSSGARDPTLSRSMRAGIGVSGQDRPDLPCGEEVAARARTVLRISAGCGQAPTRDSVGAGRPRNPRS